MCLCPVTSTLRSKNNRKVKDNVLGMSEVGRTQVNPPWGQHCPSRVERFCGSAQGSLQACRHSHRAAVPLPLMYQETSWH